MTTTAVAARATNPAITGDGPAEPLRPLPRRVKPFPNETSDSYLARLAAANHLPPDGLRHYLTDSLRRHPPLPVDRLAVLCGQPETSLLHALPDLTPPAPLAVRLPTKYRDSSPWIRPACTRCAAARGITMPVLCYVGEEDLVCHRHHRWLGQTGTGPPEQIDLTPAPEIPRANRLHHKLIHRHGHPCVQTAYDDAARTCDRWHDHHEHTDSFLALVARFDPPSVLPARHPIVEAATYPQIVTVSRQILSRRPVPPS